MRLWLVMLLLLLLLLLGLWLGLWVLLLTASDRLHAVAAAVFQRHECESAEHRIAQYYQTYAGAREHGRSGVTTTVPGNKMKKMYF